MLMAACAALLASCTNEVGEGLGIDTPIQVTASVEGIMTTRAENTKGNLDNFGLSIKDGQSYTGNYAGENIKVTGNNTDGWTFSDNKTVLYKGGGQSYYAYAPYQSIEAGATSVDFTVETDQSGSEYMQASDLLYAAGSVTSPELTINFSHKLCKLTVKLQTEADFSGTISYEHLYLRGCLPTTSLNLTDGTLDEAKGKAIDTEMWYNEESGTYECILVPQTVKYSVVIDANVNNSPKSYVYTPANAYEFKSNNSYTLTLTVKKADEPTAIEGINVAGWGENTDLTAGEATETDYTTDANGNYTVYTAEGLLKWAAAANQMISHDGINCTLAADINMTDREWESITYYGTFDGNGHTITGLKGDCFTSRNFGTIKNLTLVRPDIESTDMHVGAITGANMNIIENCHVVGGTVKGFSSNTGGIAGINNSNDRIYACSSTAEVTHQSSGQGAGGIAGCNLGTILACYATGNVTGGSYVNVGAIAGYQRDDGIQTACYWSGDAGKGVGGGLDTTTKVEGDVTWTAAMTAMNTALSGTGYQWELNPDDKTGKRPLIITNE